MGIATRAVCFSSTKIRAILSPHPLGSRVSFRRAHTYKDAVASLNLLQSNHEVVQAIRNGNVDQYMKESMTEMGAWLARLGYKPSDLNAVAAIHIAGTKGKGSTSHMISSILSQYSIKHPLLRKVGLYTSPHLRFVRERIKINNAEIDPDLFAKYFFQTWMQFTTAARTANHPDPESPATKPAYFRFLTLMALQTYLAEGVGTAVIECGIGGEYDCTNIIPQPRVTAITSLGIDHEAMLGGTVEKIAWHKAGIMKRGAKCFTVRQPREAMEVIQERARTKQVEVVEVGVMEGLELGLEGDFQKINASLAVAVAREYLQQLDVWDGESSDELPNGVKQGLKEVQYGGRCETRIDGDITWHLDGAHTAESIEVTARWYLRFLEQRDETRVLIFNQQDRAADKLLAKLREVLLEKLDRSSRAPRADLFDHVIFCTNRAFRQMGYTPDQLSINRSAQHVEELVVQKALRENWQSWQASREGPRAEVSVQPTVEDALDEVKDIVESKPGRPVRALIIGSMHLIGAALEVLESRKELRKQ